MVPLSPLSFLPDIATDATHEKRTRGQLKAAVERSLRGDRVVILDAPNNIKGYR